VWTSHESHGESPLFTAIVCFLAVFFATIARGAIVEFFFRE
jgi:hypothetical protein